MTGIRVGLALTAFAGGVGVGRFTLDKYTGIENDVEASVASMKDLKDPQPPAPTQELVKFSKEIGKLSSLEAAITYENPTFGKNPDSAALARASQYDKDQRLQDVRGQIAAIQTTPEYNDAVAPQRVYQDTVSRNAKVRADRKAELERKAGYGTYKKLNSFTLIPEGAATIELLTEAMIFQTLGRRSWPLPEKRPQPQTTGGR